VAEYIAPGDNDTKVDLTQTAEILHKLGYIVDASRIDSSQYIQEKTLLMDMWVVLKGDEHHGVSKRNLLVFLLAIFGMKFEVPPYASQGSVQEVSTFQDSYFDLVLRSFQETGLLPRETMRQLPGSVDAPESIGRFDVNGDYVLTYEEVNKIQKVYDIFYINHLSSQHTRKKGEKAGAVNADTSQLLVKGVKVSSNSSQLAEQFRSKLKDGINDLIDKCGLPMDKKDSLTYIDLLTIHRRVQLEAYEQASKEAKKQEMKECTFHPQTLTYRAENATERQGRIIGGKNRGIELFTLAKPSTQRRDRDPSEIDYEKNCNECTFNPSLVAKKTGRMTYAGPELNAKDIDKTVARLRKGNEIRVQVNLMKDRGIILKEKIETTATTSARNTYHEKTPRYPVNSRPRATVGATEYHSVRNHSLKDSRVPRKARKTETYQDEGARRPSADALIGRNSKLHAGKVNELP
jgi:hypothetical protein